MEALRWYGLVLSSSGEALGDAAPARPPAQHCCDGSVPADFQIPSASVGWALTVEVWHALHIPHVVCRAPFVRVPPWKRFGPSCRVLPERPRALLTREPPGIHTLCVRATPGRRIRLHFSPPAVGEAARAASSGIRWREGALTSRSEQAWPSQQQHAVAAIFLWRASGVHGLVPCAGI